MSIVTIKLYLPVCDRCGWCPDFTSGFEEIAEAELVLSEHLADQHPDWIPDGNHGV